jgi:hypothetical protein
MPRPHGKPVTMKVIMTRQLALSGTLLIASTILDGESSSPPASDSDPITAKNGIGSSSACFDGMIVDSHTFSIEEAATTYLTDRLRRPLTSHLLLVHWGQALDSGRSKYLGVISR